VDMAVDLIAQGRSKRTAPSGFSKNFRVTSRRPLRTTSGL